MNNKIWAKAGITIAGVLGATYITFLAAPFFVNPIINKYVPEITKSIKDVTGLNSNLEEVTLVTTPKLTAGLRVKKFELLEPNNNKILTADNFRVKMSLLPILARKIEVLPVDIYKSEAKMFKVEDGKIRLPFSTIPGLGESAAISLAESGKVNTYLSIEEMQIKTKVSKSIIESLKNIGALEGLPESSQMSLF